MRVLDARLRSWAPPAAVAVIVAAVLALVSAHIPPGPSERALDVPAFVLLVASGVLMGVCARRPRLATLAVTAVLCVFVARQYPNGPVWLTGPVALAVLSARTDRRTAVVGAVGMFAALTVSAATTAQLASLPPIFWLLWVGWSAAAVLLGEATRSRRGYLAGLAERARFLERSREHEAARRVAEERLRIARDLHDGVAHAMATINVQAGAAAHVLAQRPQAAGEALATIQRASAEVLDELGSMLAVLRDGVEPAERAPAPGVGDLTRLADTASASGLDVALRVDDAGFTPAPAIGTAVYRVVQESLTNVLRHSRARTVRVEVAAGREAALLLEVCDPGPARPHGTEGSGVGIRGMSERVIATGGRLEAGPAADGGFEVRARWDDARSRGRAR